MTLMVRSITPGRHIAHYATRDDTNDRSLVGGIVGQDEYLLRDLRPLSGWAVDIGAHIGTVAIALALDHADLQVVAVEALPDNAALISDAVRANGLGDRVHVVTAAASDDETTHEAVTFGWEWAENQPDDYMRDSRFIGNMVEPNDSSTTITCDAIGLAQIRKRFGIDRIALLKIDCEGCEWAFLQSPDVAYVDLILGEYHTRPGYDGIAAIHKLLDATHEVEHLSGDNVGHFRAVRR